LVETCRAEIDRGEGSYGSGVDVGKRCGKAAHSQILGTQGRTEVVGADG